MGRRSTPVELLGRAVRGPLAFLVVFAACLGVVPSAAFAQVATTTPSTPSGGQPSLGGFSARALDDDKQPMVQTYFTVERNAGSKFVGHLQVTNQSKDSARLHIYGVDGLTGATSGTVYSNMDDPKKGVGKWITPERDIVRLAPESSTVVDFTVRIPDGVDPGDHVGGIALESVDKPKSEGNFAVTEIIRVAVAVQVRIRGEAGTSMEITNLGLQALPGTQLPSVTVGIKNTGRLLCKPKLAVTLAQGDNTLGTVSRDLDTILPGKEIPYPLAWGTALPAGKYNANVVLSGCGPQSTRTAELELTSDLEGTPTNPGTNLKQAEDKGNGIPWWALVLVAIAALVGGWLLARRGRKSDDDDDGSSTPQLIPID